MNQARTPNDRVSSSLVISNFACARYIGEPINRAIVALPDIEISSS